MKRSPCNDWNPAQAFACLPSSEQNRLWWTAVTSNDIDAVNWIVDHTKFDLNSLQDGQPGIEYALNHNHCAIFHSILNADRVDLTFTKVMGTPILHGAAQHPDETYLAGILARARILDARKKAEGQKLAALLGVDAYIMPSQVCRFNINQTNDQKYTALMFAAGKGLLTNVNLLLDFPGINPAKQGRNQWTALDMAVLNRHWHVVERLSDVPELKPEKPIAYPGLNRFFDGLRSPQ